MFGLVFLHRIPVCSMIVGFSRDIPSLRISVFCATTCNIHVFYQKNPQAFRINHSDSITLRAWFFVRLKMNSIFRTTLYIYSLHMIFTFQIFEATYKLVSFSQCFCNLCPNFKLKWSFRPCILSGKINFFKGQHSTSS